MHGDFLESYQVAWQPHCYTRGRGSHSNEPAHAVCGALQLVFVSVSNCVTAHYESSEWSLESHISFVLLYKTHQYLVDKVEVNV